MANTGPLAAVAAVVHDVLVVLGMVPLAAYISGTPLGPAFGETRAALT